MEIITRAEARGRGLIHYFTGKICKRGHLSARFISTATCVECSKTHSTKWAEDNPEKHSYFAKRWQRNNLSQRSKTATAYVSKRKSTDIVFAMKINARTFIANSIRKGGYKKNSKTSEILGCSWPEFSAHIERQFLPGMTWDNRRLWHIDHIVPLASAATKEELLALNHFTNLRPLWAVDNIKKKDACVFLI